MHTFTIIAEKITNKLIKIENEKVLFNGGEYTAEILTEDNFTVLNRLDKENINNTAATILNNNNSQIVFIDGGNAELLKTPAYSLHCIKVAVVIFVNNKSIKTESYQYYVLISAKENKNDIYYEVEFYPIDNNNNNNDDNNNSNNNIDGVLPKKEHLNYHSYDKTIISGIDRADISKIGEISRKFSELLLADKIAKQMQENDIIVLDNSLKCYYTNEEVYWCKLFETVNLQKLILAGLAKTTTLITEKGSSLISILNHLAEKREINNKCWFYYPIVNIKSEKYPAEILFIKLHELAEYIFKLEVYNKSFNKQNLQLLLSILQFQANDGAFLGYPYGLIKVDQFARISNKEKEYLQLLFMANSGNNYKIIKQALSACNAHGILDGKY